MFSSHKKMVIMWLGGLAKPVVAITFQSMSVAKHHFLSLKRIQRYLSLTCPWSWKNRKRKGKLGFRASGTPTGSSRPWVAPLNCLPQREGGFDQPSRSCFLLWWQLTGISRGMCSHGDLGRTPTSSPINNQWGHRDLEQTSNRPQLYLREDSTQFGINKDWAVSV